MTGTTLTRATAIFMGAFCLLMADLSLAAAGMIEFVSGDATIQRGMEDIPAAKGVAVESGDSLVTGDEGRLSIVMENGERIALHPNTKFVIDDFKPPESASKPETGRSFYTFVRGGFDAIVNSLGRRDTTSYRIKTPVATLGIRGTAYTVVWTPEGLYIKVTEGSVTATNAAGTITAEAGQIIFVGLGGVPPVLVDSMPLAGVGVGEGAAGTTGLGLPAGIAAALGGLVIILNNDDGSSGTTTTTTTTPNN